MTITHTEAVSRMLELVRQADLVTLARFGAHEYDEDAVVPAAGSAGAAALHSARDVFADWVQAQGRFPTEDEVEDEVVTRWSLDAAGSEVARAFVDLGLYYSHHAGQVASTVLETMRAAVSACLWEVAFTLAKEYGPIV